MEQQANLLGLAIAIFLCEVLFALAAPSKFSTIAKAKAKLEEIEKQKDKTWTVFGRGGGREDAQRG